MQAAKEHQMLEGGRTIDDTAVQPQGDASQYLWGRCAPLRVLQDLRCVKGSGVCVV